MSGSDELRYAAPPGGAAADHETNADARGASVMEFVDVADADRALAGQSPEPAAA